MQTSTFFFCLVLSCLCFALAHVSFDDCCLNYAKDLKHRAQKHAVRYIEQKPDGDCNLHAVIFIMRRGRKFCSNPEEKWVPSLMKSIDARPKSFRPKASRKRHPQYPN